MVALVFNNMLCGLKENHLGPQSLCLPMFEMGRRTPALSLHRLLWGMHRSRALELELVAAFLCDFGI